MLTITREQWSATAAAMLAPAIAHDPLCSLDMLDTLPLFVARQDGRPVLAYLLRIDETPNGNEGVIVAAGGHCAGVDLTRAVLPFIERQMIAEGADWIRIHTARPGLAAKLARQGYGLREWVYAKRLKGGDAGNSGGCSILGGQNGRTQ